MPNLELVLFGPFQANLEGQPVSGFESARVRALLIYLAVERDQPHSRDTLAGLLWPEAPDRTARKNLRQALSNLRKVIADHSAEPPYLRITREAVQFMPDSHHFADITEFISLIEETDRHQHRRLESCRFCADKLQRAVDFYRGEFLQGFFLGDSVAFQDWILLRRERYHRQAIQALTVLTQFYEQRGEYDLARKCAYRQVEFDPWREAGHQYLMRLLALDGEHSAALKQYQNCRDILMEELGVDPSPETIQLYEQIKAHQLVPDPEGALWHNLPPQTTSFVGRDAELRDLLALISDPNNRLVTIVGSGGVGKTRLVSQVAFEAAYDFGDGACFVPLVSVSTAEALPAAIADALGFAFQGREHPTDQLINFLGNKDLLLVLDNYEHLLDDLDLVIKILRQAPGTFLLVSSREHLGLQAEQLLDLGGLPFSNAETGPAQALILFAERAGQVKPDFSLDDDTLQHVAGICGLVQGSPLAIELAASQVRQWTCAEIESQIQHSLDALATSMRDLPERHRSLRATFERSWGLLSPQEKAIFQKFAIFRGGFTAQAAMHIVAAGMTDLAALIDKSLLRRHPDGRFDLHPLIEQYLREKLAQDSHDETATYDRMSAFFAGFLQEAESKLKSSQQPEFLDAISLDFGNIQNAWQWSLKNNYLDQIDQSLEGLYLFFEGRSRYQEGEAFFRNCLDALDENMGAVYWRVSVRYGALSYRMGAYDRAQGLFDRCLGAFQRLGDRNEEAFTHYANGNLAYLRGNFELAVEQYQHSLDISSSEGMAYVRSQALNGLGLSLYMQGEYPPAQNVFMESLEIHREIGDPWGQAIRNNNLALVAHALGQYSQAKEFYAHSLDLWKRIRQDFGLASCYNNMGLVSEALGDYAEARDLYSDALEIFQRLGHRYGMASCMNNLGNAAVSLGELDQAQHYYREAFAIRKALGDARGIASVLNNLGRVSELLEEHKAARDYFLRALEVGWENKGIPVVLDSLLGLTNMLLVDSSPSRAVELLSIVINHSGSNQEAKDRAADMLERLRVDYQGSDFEEVQMRVEDNSLDRVVSEILAEIK